MNGTSTTAPAALQVDGVVGTYRPSERPEGMRRQLANEYTKRTRLRNGDVVEASGLKITFMDDVA